MRSGRLPLFASGGGLFADPRRHRPHHSFLRRRRDVCRLLHLLHDVACTSDGMAGGDWRLLSCSLSGAIGTAALGDDLQHGVFSPLIKAPSQAIMIASIGVSIVLQEAMRLHSGGREQWLPPFATGTLVEGDFDGFSVRISYMQGGDLSLRRRACLRARHRPEDIERRALLARLHAEPRRSLHYAASMSRALPGSRHSPALFSRRPPGGFSLSPMAA